MLKETIVKVAQACTYWTFLLDYMIPFASAKKFSEFIHLQVKSGELTDVNILGQTMQPLPKKFFYLNFSSLYKIAYVVYIVHFSCQFT